MRVACLVEHGKEFSETVYFLEIERCMNESEKNSKQQDAPEGRGCLRPAEKVHPEASSLFGLPLDNR